MAARSRTPVFNMLYQKGAPTLSSIAESKMPRTFCMLRELQSGADISPVLPRMESTSETTRLGTAGFFVASLGDCAAASCLFPVSLIGLFEFSEADFPAFGAASLGLMAGFGAGDLFNVLPVPT